MKIDDIEPGALLCDDEPHYSNAISVRYLFVLEYPRRCREPNGDFYALKTISSGRILIRYVYLNKLNNDDIRLKRLA